MFGFSLKDSFGQPLYKELTFEELENLCNGMVAFAKSQPPFDYDKAVADAKADDKVKSEMVGPMLRVRGPAAIKMCDQYNKFVRIGLHALQITYYEMDVPEIGRMGQMTLVDNYGLPLEKELVWGFAEMFFGDEWRQVHLMETPPHVAVGVRAVTIPT